MITLNLKYRKGGKLIFGFPGIGKSTCSSINHNYVDLESSHFKNDAQFPGRYCEVAYQLAMQGSSVFMSTHKNVRDHICDTYLEKLNNFGVSVCIVCPSISMKNEWINRLFLRYVKQPSDKNKRAYDTIKAHYDEYVTELMDYAINNNIKLIVINELDYNLLDLI